MFTELHREEKREKGDRGGQEEKRGESKGERQIQPVISSLSVFHPPEHTKRFTELGREEKGEGGDRGDPNEMRWNQKRREQASHFLMCAPQSGPLRNVHRVIQRREEGGRRQRWPGE